MGVMDWLRGLFGRDPKRDVSTIAADGSADATSETVSRTPEPMKAGSRRLTFRDARLLPKQRPAIDVRRLLPGQKRKRIMARDEADRLFARTMRTRNREIRDLATDTAQLERYGLPAWTTEAELAAALDLTVGKLRHYSVHRDRELRPHYVAFAIRKRSGGQRIIHAPKTRLKAIQRRLHELLVAKLPTSTHAHGFVKGRSIASNAAPHVGKAVVIKLDLQDCFPTIHFGRVRGLFIALGYAFPVATTLAVLTTEAPRQPVEAEGKLFHVPVGPRVCVQGAPTSPGLCNAVLARLDRRIAGLARKHGFTYTRYADDLVLSGDDLNALKPLLTLVPRIVRDEGFAINPSKTLVMRRGRQQRVTGVTVNEQLGLSRRERRRLRAAVHRQRQGDVDAHAQRQLAGQLAYLAMLNAKQAAPLLAKLHAPR
jgi:RNA-directed DNA polymerase